MGIYKDLVIDNLKYNIENEIDTYSYPFPRFSRYVGDIKPNSYTVVAGRLGSGKTSFVDYTYVFNLFIQWKNNKEKGIDRPFKILYFSLNDTKQVKLQKWTSLFLYAKHSIIADLATLNNESNKLVEVDDLFTTMVEEAEEFFNLMLDEDTIEIIDGQKSAATIFNIVTAYMDSIGSVVDSKYVLDQGYEGAYTSVIIDSTDKVLTEATGYGTLSKDEILSHINDYALTFKNYYNISTVVVHPTPNGIIRGPKDTEPKYLDLGHFAQDCDKGIVLYDPHGEHNYTFTNIETMGFISKTGVNRLRTLHLVKNKTGASNMHVSLGFYPENGYLIELPSRRDAEDYENVRTGLYENQ